MRRDGFPLVLLVAALLAPSAHADDPASTGSANRPDAHAPIGVMGDHMHRAGEWMASYRYGYMWMDGNRDGTDRLSRDEVLADFMVTPTRMSMQMHMFGLMFAPTDWLTGMVMLPVVLKDMDHLTRMGTKFTTSTEGIGDLRLSGLFRLWDNETHHLHFNFGLGIPTGSIRRKDATPADPDTTLPFPMQLGSGTLDWMPGLTYLGRAARFSWGAQAVGTLRTGKNYAGWAMGDQADVTAWFAVPWTRWLSTSLRVGYRYWGNYRGNEDRPPPPPSIPTARPDLQGGHAVDLLGGINLIVPLGRFLGEHRFGFELGGPVEQWLRGPQLETDWHLMVGWQKAF